MATFSTKVMLGGSPALISEIASKIAADFRNNGYEVATDSLSSGGCDISITKGGAFKAVLGMKTALKVTLLPHGNLISFEAGVGIWGQQAIPTVISMLFFWPVVITQIWGMVQQSNLDDKALAIAKDTVYMSNATAAAAPSPAPGGNKFCTNCGTRNDASAKFCCGCGKML